MKKRMLQLLTADESYAKDKDIAMCEFGLSVEKHYDVLVVAPGWKPTKIMADYDVEITCTKAVNYISGYEVKGKDFLLGWIQCSSGASSLIDELSTCAWLNFDKLVFVGAVGSLVPEIGLGALCTPSGAFPETWPTGIFRKISGSISPSERSGPMTLPLWSRWWSGIRR